MNISAQPTPLLVRSNAGVQQAIDLLIEGEGSATGAELVHSTAQSETRISLSPLPAGETLHRVFLPEAAATETVLFSLEVGGESVASCEVVRGPVRRWQVYLVHTSHHDLGYTDIPSNILREHAGFLDEILRFCDETDDWPDDARFRYTIEQAWSAAYWAAHRPPEHVARLMRRLRDGRIELTALLGNETSELCGHEEQARLLYTAARLARAAGVPLLSAELNDIPGISWGLAGVLSAARVPYFAPSIPDYFAWGQKRRYTWDEGAVLPRDVPGAFWWQAADGGRVLFWHSIFAHAELWTLAQAERDLPRQLARLETRGYPHLLIRLLFQAGRRDNSPPDRRLSDIAAGWNAAWASPRLIVATNRTFFQAFEQAAGASLPTLRGELPNTDYTVGATSTAAALGVNRVAVSDLAAAERIAVCAALDADYAYPAQALAEAYDSALFFDEHTWGMANPAGPAQDASVSQKTGFAFRAAALTHDTLSKSLNRLADAVRLEQPGYHVVVFNPLGQDRTDVAFAPAAALTPAGKPMHWRETGDPAAPRVMVNVTAIGRDLVALPPEWLDEPLELVDAATDRATPCQVVRTDDPFAARPHAAGRVALAHTDPSSLGVLNYGAAQAVDLAWTVQDAPAVGYRTYRLARAAGPAASSLHADNCLLENRFYRLRVDPQSGAVVSLYDKELGRELVDPAAPEGFNALIARHPHDSGGQAATVRRVRVQEQGPVLASLAWEGEARGCPRTAGEITLYDRVKRVDFSHRLLRDAAPLCEHYIAFPFSLARPRFRFQASNTVIEPVADQLPGSNTSAYTVQQWVSVANEAAEVLWTTREAPVVLIGALWPLPVSQAHHGATPPGFDRPFLRDPRQFTHARLYSLVMTSNFRTNFAAVQPSDALFRYSLTSRTPDDAGTATALGEAASLPFAAAWVEGPQTGTLPPVRGYVALDAVNVSLMALKASEDGGGLVVRLRETAGRSHEVTLALPYVRIAGAAIATLLEDPVSSLAHEEHAVRVPMPAWGIVTVRLALAERGAFPTVTGSWLL